jgi:hypothetical protein
VKPNVVVFQGQDQDIPEVPSSSSFSPSPQRQTRGRTVHEKSPSKEVRQEEKEEQESLLSLMKVEPVESESEEESDPAAARQLTIDETCSLPKNVHFIIDDSSSEDEDVHPVDHGLLPVNCIQLNWLRKMPTECNIIFHVFTN